MTDTSPCTAPRVRSGPALYLASYGLSLLGKGVAGVLVPLLVLERTGDVFAAGLLATVSTATAAAVGILGGLVVDRFDRRAVSAVSDVAAAASTAALPLVDAVWGLDLPWFLVLAVVGAAVRVPGTTAHEALLPALARLGGARRGALDRLLGIRETLANVLLLAGPGLGGLLAAVLGLTPTLLLLTAATSVAAAGLTLAVDPRAGRVPPVRRMADDDRGTLRRTTGELLAGWRFLVRSRIVLGATLVSASFVAIISALQSTLMPAYFTAEELPALTGLTLSAFAGGSIVGSTVFAATSGRERGGVRRRTWFVVGMVGSLVGFAALGTLASPWVVLGAAALVGVTNAPATAVLGVLTVEATPEIRRGRVLGAQNAILLGAPALTGAPLGAVAAGAGLHVAAAALAVFAGITAVAALLAPVFHDLEGVAGMWSPGGRAGDQTPGRAAEGPDDDGRGDKGQRDAQHDPRHGEAAGRVERVEPLRDHEAGAEHGRHGRGRDVVGAAAGSVLPPGVPPAVSQVPDEAGEWPAHGE
ncbi:putative MFS family arabinose efflux permease [Actinomycetospora cinnamomea]|uniref:Multidrug efflux pump Tap n=1 Tax=Actinomycetospora cinnamomea TaxID=663609 RepID=A0A2U1EBE3_9PSEU|nr:putative MFS family arabinose efflux permease [Actinomycetospora cinnamomea]